MTGEIIGNINKPPIQQPLAPNELCRYTITVFKNGQVRVDGPIDNLILWGKVLSMANSAVVEYCDKQIQESKRLIQVPKMAGAGLKVN